MGASFSLVSADGDVLGRLSSATGFAPPLPAIAAGAAVVAVTALIGSQLLSRPSNLPPGPKPVPIFGNLLSFGDDPPATLMEWATQYGPVMTVSFGTVRTVILSSPEAVKEAMVTKGAETAGRLSSPSFKLATGHGSGIAFSETAKWRKLRKAVNMNLLHKSQFMKHLPMMQEEVEAAKAAIMAKLGGKPGLVEPIQQYLRVLALNVILRMLLSERLEYGDAESNPEISELNDALSEVFSALEPGAPEDFVPLLHLLPTPHMTRLKRAVATRDAILRNRLSERRKEIERNGGPTKNDVLDALILSQEEKGISEFELLHTCSDLVGAGADTSSFTVGWLIRLLAAHPEAQLEVQRELDGVFGSSGVPPEIPREKLPILSATILEAMRIRTVAAMILPHRTVEAINIGGFDIPAGTQLFTNNYALMMDPTLWDRPEEFRPRRFLEEEASVKLLGAESRPNVDAYKFVPFGVGPRYCPGQAMAQVEVFLAAAHMLHAFWWEAPPGEEVNLERKLGLTVETKVYQELMCTPRHP